MKDLNLYKVLSYNVFVYITEDWKYIVDVDEDKFKKVISEAEACAKKNGVELVSEIDENDKFCNGDIIYKNYKINDREFAYISFIKIDWD